MTIQNDSVIRVLQGKPVTKTPIWIMRQAGRYLPEYRQLRKETGSFLSLCKSPELACQTTLMPIDRYDLDAAIIFSDILVVPEAMGMELRFEEKTGPIFSNPIRNENELKKLNVNQIFDSLTYVFEAIELTKKELNNRIPLIGFSGSPWTLACYMIEGGTSKNFETVLKMMYCNPTLLLNILDDLTKIVTDYLILQQKHGADILMIFDTWGGILPFQNFNYFSLQFNKRIIDNLNQKGILNIIFSKHTFNHLPNILKSNPSGIGLDWTVSVEEAQKIIKNKVAIQGNLDPTILLTNEKTIQLEVKKLLGKINHRTRHIFNLGHGITPSAKPENVEVLIETVHNYR